MSVESTLAKSALVLLLTMLLLIDDDVGIDTKFELLSVLVMTAAELSTLLCLFRTSFSSDCCCCFDRTALISFPADDAIIFLVSILSKGVAELLVTPSFARVFASSCASFFIARI